MDSLILEGKLAQVYACSVLEEGPILVVPHRLYLTRVSIEMVSPEIETRVVDAIVYGVVPQNYEGRSVTLQHHETSLEDGMRLYYQTLRVNTEPYLSIAAVSRGPLPNWKDVGE